MVNQLHLLLIGLLILLDPDLRNIPAFLISLEQPRWYVHAENILVIEKFDKFWVFSFDFGNGTANYQPDTADYALDASDIIIGFWIVHNINQDNLEFYAIQ